MNSGVKRLTGISDSLREEVCGLTLSEIVRTYVEVLGGIRPAARFFKVNPGTIAHALEHEPKRTSKMGRALIKRGVLRPKRIRLAADVTEEQKDALQTWAKYHFGGWTELCREMAECLLAEDGSVSMTFSWHKYSIFDGGDDD